MYMYRLNFLVCLPGTCVKLILSDRQVDTLRGRHEAQSARESEGAGIRLQPAITPMRETVT
jgi:hypothetical protein